MGDISALLPDSLNLPPHLSAHKYFYVCTLTVAAWDTLVLSPRDWRLLKTKEWPILKIIFQILRYLMPIDFVVTSVAFFHTEFTLDMCQRFYLFEPIATLILVCLCSAVHVIRVHAIYDKSRAILGGLGLLLLLQVATMAVACAFYKVMILKPGQGCIAGPIASWVGIYWVAPTFFFSVSFALALARSLQSLKVKPLSPWKLMLRDGLNLYAAIWLVNMVNMLFWFIVQPQDQPGIEDTIRTMVTSMTAVLTTTMTMRIILSVRGSLSQGGAYAGTSTAGSGSRSGTTHVLSRPPPQGGFSTHSQGAGVINIGNNPAGTYTGAPYTGSRGVAPTYTLDEMRSKAEREYMEEGDGRSSLAENKEMPLGSADSIHGGNHGVKVTIDREVDYHGRN